MEAIALKFSFKYTNMLKTVNKAPNTRKVPLLEILSMAAETVIVTHQPDIPAQTQRII